MKNTIVVALGGNALRKKGEPLTFENQLNNAKKCMENLIPLFKNGYRVVITHGNGPQVGIEFYRNIFSRKTFKPYPLDALNAETQGWIGYVIVSSLRNEFLKQGIQKEVVALVTEVIVKKDDPAFQHPTKPIGHFLNADEAKALREKFGWTIKDDAGRGLRMVVASPIPVRTIEAGVIRNMIGQDIVVVATGGGGIPVSIERDGTIRGEKAVIDKDRASALLAKEISADYLMILTEVENVFINFGKANQAALRKVSVSEIKTYMEQGHFAPGSMGPKIESAIEFLENGGKGVFITSIEKASQCLIDQAGTHIIP